MTQIDAHIHESISVRDMVTKDNLRVATMERNMEEIVKDIKTIKSDISTIRTDFFRGLLTVILSIFLAVVVSIGTAIWWSGRYVEKLERLDRLHQEDYKPDVRMP